MPRKKAITYHREYLEKILFDNGERMRIDQCDRLAAIWSIKPKSAYSILNGRRDISGTKCNVISKLSLLADYYSLDLNMLSDMENDFLKAKEAIRSA